MEGFCREYWSKLTDIERIQHCRDAAKEAASYAQSVSPEWRQFCTDLAAQWEKLAAEIEQGLVKR